MEEARTNTLRERILVLVSLLALVNSPHPLSGQLLAAAPFPTLMRSGSIISVQAPLITSQFDLTRSSFTVFYPQDQEQEFRMGIAFSQLMEITASNSTAPAQVVDSTNLVAQNWNFTRLANASEVRFGPNMQGQLSTIAQLQRGIKAYAVIVSLTIFASQRQNETAVIAYERGAGELVAIESVGGPTEIKLVLSITGWPFRTQTDSLALRLLIDGSRGTVRHHGEFSATELFNTVGVVNDVTQHQDASIIWLRRAVVDNGTKVWSDVSLSTFSSSGTLEVNLYYPSFSNSILTHNLIIETSNTFQPAGFVPLQSTILITGATTLLTLTLLIAYLTRRSQFTLRRNR